MAQVTEGSVVRRKGKRSTGLGLFSALGGLLLVGGTLLPWLDTGGVNVGAEVVSGTPNGVETSTGMIVLSAGIVSVLASIVLMSTSRISRVVALIVLAAGVTGLVGPSMILMSPRDAYVDFAADELGVGSSDIENSLNSLFDIGGIQDDPAVGIYVSLAGGGVTFLSGAIGFLILRKRRIQPMTPADESDSEPEDGQDVGGTVWERSFDDAERTVDRIEDRPEAPPAADPDEDHTAQEPAEAPAQQRKDVLGDSWAG